MKLTTTLFLSAILSALSLSAAPQNILLIIADDYGVDSCPLYNSSGSQPPTPNIISLAQSGVLFRNSYANPICSPTRACLITGRHGFRTGIGDVIMGTTNPTLTASEFTLPEAFAANPSLDYQLAQFGKWHLANAVNSPRNIGGWPYFAGSLMGGLASYTNWTKTVNGVSTANYTNYATTDIVNDAISWIQSQGTKPWFAWVAFNSPHTPLHKPPNNLCPHYTTLSGTTQDINANSRKYFEAMVEAMDTEIGRLLASMDRTNTHIIFLGDNGTQGVVQPPYPANRGKDTLYEGGIHVPFIVAGPAVTTPGRTNDTPVHVVDVFSTILELAGIDVAKTIPTNITIDSRSFLPTLQTTSNFSRYVYAEKFGDNTNTDARILRNMQFKLIKFASGREEFYELSKDPYEGTNLLTAPLNASAQSNYYALTLHFAGYQQTLAQPVIMTSGFVNEQFRLTIAQQTNLTYSLWHAFELSDLSWSPLTNAVATTNANAVSLTDTNATGVQQFYRVVAKSP